MRLLLPSVLIIIFIHACESDRPHYKHTQIKKLEWILGSWQDTSTDMHFTETWRKENDSTFAGDGFGVENGDTIFREKLELAERNDEVFYVATVNEHLAGKPTTFSMVSDSSNKWIFENPNHDFPQRIIYILTSENTLHARVEGTVNGKLQGEDFNMQRISKP
ncbi:MAG: DUF6265 family protein [Bacteroidia bacterium]